MEPIVNALFGPLMRDSRHVREQREGREMIAQRLGIPGPWQPEMVNFPAFTCAHCHFAHILRQTLLGCSACAAPYLTSEVISLNRNGQLICQACSTQQEIAAMPFCCTNCRCIQGVPSDLDWRRTFVQLPSWRFYIGPAIPLILGVLVILICCLVAATNNAVHADGPMLLGIMFGFVPAVVGALALTFVLRRKKTPAELMLSCGGFGVVNSDGETRWFSWQDVRGLETKTPALNSSSIAAQPDSIAVGWIIHLAQETIFFDFRFKEAQLFARQLRMRSPGAVLMDLPWLVRTNPWAVWIVALIIVLIIGGIVAVTAR